VARKKQIIKSQDTRLKDYELVFIPNPDVTEEALETKLNGISEFITGREGVISSIDKWGKKKLAYPIKHFLEGNYVLARFQISPAKCKELDANLKISEEVLRHLLIRVGS
jgi:small subunit ribosomal protein S6